MRVNPMNSKRLSLRYAWNTFLGTSAVRITDFASDVFFFAWMVLSRVILFLYPNGLDARLAESSSEGPYNNYWAREISITTIVYWLGILNHGINGKHILQ